MNCGQFRDPAYHMCHAGTVVASWSLTQEMTGLNPFNNKYFQSLNTASSAIFTLGTTQLLVKFHRSSPLFTKKVKLSEAGGPTYLSKDFGKRWLTSVAFIACMLNST